MSDDDDNRLSPLRALPRTDVSAEHAERLRRQAQTVFQESAAQSSFARQWSLVWNRVLEPGLMAVIIVVYAGWAVRSAASLLQSPPEAEGAAHFSPRPPVRLAALEAPPAPK